VTEARTLGNASLKQSLAIVYVRNCNRQVDRLPFVQSCCQTVKQRVNLQGICEIFLSLVKAEELYKGK
jgi:hypothetical protein